jgi:pyruvate/2-oxoglutarate dehydrogenase complex dihydrolipoamide acyltransferase (E2) component
LHWFWCSAAVLATLLLSAAHPAAAQRADDKIAEAAGFVIEVRGTEADVLRAVQSVVEETVIYGTHVYDKEDTLTGAEPAKNSELFAPWHEPGQVFFKVLTKAVAPRHFKDSNDVGTIAIRYVVQPVNELHTRLRIDAVFVEDMRRKAHASDGTVETSEFNEIQGRLHRIQLEKQETAASLRKRQDADAAKAILMRQRQEEAATLEASRSSIRDLEQRLHDLQHDLELKVKGPNTELKSAPFHSASKLQSLSAGSEVVILIVTPYWYGVETTDGHRGWLRHDQVEPFQ